jgi:glyoxylase-like metal-dependent hydrolase (beta-lactamase superfamily II)
MDAALLANRITLRVLMQNHPNGSLSTLADAVGRLLSWVKTWRTRLRAAAPDDPTVLFGHSPYALSYAALEHRNSFSGIMQKTTVETERGFP